MGAYVNGKKTVTANTLTTDGMVYLGSQTPILPAEDGDVWVAGMEQIGNGIVVATGEWGASLLTTPANGFGTHQDGVANFDLTGGLYEKLFTKTSGAWNFASTDVGKVIMLTAGTHKYALAMVQQYVSTTEVVLETCGWDADFTGDSFWLFDDPISFTSPALKINSIGATSEWENNAHGHTGAYATLFYLSASGNLVNTIRIQTDANGFANVDSMTVRHATGAVASGNIQNAMRVTIDDSAVTSSGAEIGCVKYVRATTTSPSRTDAVRVGTGFLHALHVDGSVATDPFYGGTFVSGYATVTRRSNLGVGITLANDLRTKILAHAADGAEHYHGGGATPDTVNFATMPAASTDLASLKTLVAYQLTGYAAHHTDALAAGGGSYHNAQFPDATGTLTSAVAPTTMDECITRLNDLRAKYIIHDAATPVHTTGGLHPTLLTALTGDGSFINTANNVQMFTSNTTGIVIGSDTPFSVIAFTAATPASQSITPTWQYSTGAGTWATLSVSDTTVGMSVTGKVSFTPPADWAVTAWAGGAGVGEITNAYYVRILRTRATLATPPTESFFKIYAGANQSDAYIRGDGSYKPSEMADVAAQAGSVYISLTGGNSGTIVYKDTAGSVHALY
jgi:hypothetical protein